MELNRAQEWKQIFDDAWRYERDYFYDPNMHGRDWNEVYDRYAPLVPYIKHRSDLTYILDQMNGELSVGHSFVFGGDYPAVDENQVGLLGADLMLNEGKWKISRIFTTESWNPGLVAPLATPELKVNEGDFILAIDDVKLRTLIHCLMVSQKNKQCYL
jgi:tricorn protease